TPVSARLSPLAAVTLLLLPARSAPAQSAKAAAPYDTSVFAALSWREIGIFRAGRSVAVAGSAARPQEYWFGTTGGGGFKSIDGGKTWNKVLFRNDSTGAADLILDPSNPDVLYAGLWQAVRRPWTLVSGGPGSGMFKSTDGGEHWTELTKNPGLPTGLWGNIG